MKHDIKINMQELEQIRLKFRSYTVCLEQLKRASATFHAAIKDQDSQAYEKLSGIWEEDVMEAEKALIDRFSTIEKALWNYTRIMESFIAPKDPSVLMRVDEYDICHNYNQIVKHTQDISGILEDTASSWNDYKKVFIANPFESEEENEARRENLKQEERKEQEKRERNYNKLEAFRQLLQIKSSGIISDHTGSIQKIYIDSVIPFVERDAVYGNVLDGYYDEWKSFGDGLWDIGVVTADVIRGSLDAVVDLVTGIAVLLKVAQIYTNPCGFILGCLDEDVREMVTGAIGLLEDPGNALEAIGQSIFDQADENGTAYAVGYVVTDLGVEILLSKGAGKLSKAGKLGDIADTAGDIAKVTDDAVDAGKLCDDVRIKGGTSTSRPTWRQSELDAATDFPDYDAQKSFINGEEVPYGTKGSVRPDYYKDGFSVDIKNYSVESASGRRNLARNIEKQYYQRIENLPDGTKQSVMIDVRGQNVSDAALNALYDDIMQRTNNGVEILFKMD